MDKHEIEKAYQRARARLAKGWMAREFFEGMPLSIKIVLCISVLLGIFSVWNFAVASAANSRCEEVCDPYAYDVLQGKCLCVDEYGWHAVDVEG